MINESHAVMPQQLIPFFPIESPTIIVLRTECLHPHDIVAWIFVHACPHVIASAEAKLFKCLLHRWQLLVTDGDV